MSEPIPDPIVIGNAVLAIKARLAPAGSLRERGLRLVTRPLVRALMRRHRAAIVADVASHPKPTVVRWLGLAERAETLPQQPRILILKLDHIGDFIVGMPAIAHIRTAFPDAALTLVCASWNRPWRNAPAGSRRSCSSICLPSATLTGGARPGSIRRIQGAWARRLRHRHRSAPRRRHAPATGDGRGEIPRRLLRTS